MIKGCAAISDDSLLQPDQFVAQKTLFGVE
jgi:hypothetical protein